MKQNVGGIDRKLRIVLGLAIIGAGVMYGSWWGAVGAVPLLTGLMGWCPPYAIMGMSTCKIKQG
ncbi:MAG TPA: DUF2892 domain-containing protein [Gammaproteobacteria bacterium]|nr:DUF2892 domain-containing protein [Gammaproteobacteria bacterium]